MYWENMALGLIGETIDDADDICGCRVVDKGKPKSSSNKTLFKLELWMRNADTVVADKLRGRLQDCLSEGDSTGRGKSRNLPDFDYKKH